MKTKQQKDTQIVAEHFYDHSYLHILAEGQYTYLHSQIRINITTSFIITIVFLFTLIATFSLLENKALSLIPLFSLFVVSISIMFLILNIFRYLVISKVISREYEIDKSFLNLLIKKKHYEENIFKIQSVSTDYQDASPRSIKTN
jgi:hypothetical protein